MSNETARRWAQEFHTLAKAAGSCGPGADQRCLGCTELAALELEVGTAVPNLVPRLQALLGKWRADATDKLETANYEDPIEATVLRSEAEGLRQAAAGIDELLRERS